MYCCVDESITLDIGISHLILNMKANIPQWRALWNEDKQNEHLQFAYLNIGLIQKVKSMYCM